jgi:hypothetical protein
MKGGGGEGARFLSKCVIVIFSRITIFGERRVKFRYCSDSLRIWKESLRLGRTLWNTKYSSRIVVPRSRSEPSNSRIIECYVYFNTIYILLVVVVPAEDANTKWRSLLLPRHAGVFVSCCVVLCCVYEVTLSFFDKTSFTHFVIRQPKCSIV